MTHPRVSLALCSQLSRAPSRIVSFLLVTLLLAMISPTGWALPLSPGDRVKVSIPEGDLFSGNYEVDADGAIRIPYVGDLAVQGLEVSEAEALIAQTLVSKKLFQPQFIQVSVQMISWAPLQIPVTGATFQPGRVLINDRQILQNSQAQNVGSITGNYPIERYVSSAIRAAGGVTPLADLKNIKLQRGNQELTLDLSGLMSGDFSQDMPLIAGDRVIVPNAPKFQNYLVRPSQITPPGIKVFTSNLTVPANSNSAAAIRDAVSFPYGSRFSQAVIAANCVGGTQATNANRKAILVRTDRLVGETIVLERSVEDLVKKSLDDSVNPFLMPNDGIACYDSEVTNVRDAFGTLADILSPINLLRVIFFP